MKNIITAILISLPVSVSAAPSMSVFTVNAQNPAAYVDWAGKSGPAIGEAISSTTAGVCIPTAGFEQPGDLFLYYLFPSAEVGFASATAPMTNAAVISEIGKLQTERTVRLVDSYTIMNPTEPNFEIGQSFANWNIIVDTDSPAEYVSELNAFKAAAAENGFEDVAMVAYGIDTGEHAGKIMASIQAPTPERLGAFIDARSSKWAQKHLKKFAKIREYEHAYTMVCNVIQA